MVADAIAYYDELLAGPFDPSGWWRDHVDEVMAHWQGIVDIESWVLRPFMIGEQAYADMKRDLELVMQALAIAVERLAADPALRKTLGIPAYLEPLIEIDHERGKPSVLGRLDAVMTDGVLQLLEYNAEPMTVAFQYELERSFDRLPITRAFARRFQVRRVDLYDELFTALQPMTVAILDRAVWKSPRRATRFRPLMACAGRGCPVLSVEPEELEYRDGKLTSGGIPIDMVALGGWELLINARKRLAKVIKAAGDGAVRVYGGISRGLLASYKVVFELLSSTEYRDLFSPELAAALDRHVPWTRGLRERMTDKDGARVDLLPYVAEHRESLVIKPAGGSGGGDVTIGRDVTAEIWQAAIGRGVTQGWIVQALATPERARFPVVDARGQVTHHDVSCERTPYVWNGAHIAGLLCRVTTGGVLHDSGDRPIGIANGIEVPTWIVSA